MYRRLITLTITSLFILSLAGCAADGSVSKRKVGTVGGAIIGGLIGTQIGAGSGRTIAIIAGAALGAYLGSEVGDYMDRQDQVNTQQAVADTPTHHTAYWTNDKGNHFQVTPNDDIYYDQANKRYCRDFTQSVTAGGEVHTVNGKACAPEKSGPWEIVSAKQ